MLVGVPYDSPVAQRLPRGCTRILLARLRGSGRSQLKGATLAANNAKSRRPRSSQEPPACRVMAVPSRLFGTLRILVREARLPAF